jgi:hypothetical protein
MTKGTPLLYVYPDEFSQVVLDAWRNKQIAPPSEKALREVLSVCFQSSLMREEERPITFRLFLGEASELPDDGGPPRGVQVLPLATPREFNPGEIRRMSPAVDFHRAMIGVSWINGELKIWGLIYTGPGWIREVHGGRDFQVDLPQLMIVHVRGQGNLAVYCGNEVVATLHEGEVELGDVDVFRSRWLRSLFADVREEVMALHLAAREHASGPWATVDPNFVRMLAQHVLRRTVSTICSQKHGATLLFLPPDPENDGSLTIKYPFVRSPGRGRFRSVMVEVMNTLAELHSHDTDRMVGWKTYSESPHPAITELDDAAFEVGHLFAGLSAVDGALVLTRRLEVHGFGAEISHQLPPVHHVWRALDIEGTRVAPDLAERFGTRHRSVFRLCERYPEVLAIVISQDGHVRFVKHFTHHGVVYFDHRMLSTT